MALHGAQGPQLGLPQMISSRVQFGVFGAAIPIVAVCLMQSDSPPAAQFSPAKRSLSCSVSSFGGES